MHRLLCSKRHLMILEDVDYGEKCKEGEGKLICLGRNGWRDFAAARHQSWHGSET